MDWVAGVDLADGRTIVDDDDDDDDDDGSWKSWLASIMATTTATATITTATNTRTAAMR